jgi:hypothetical protein
MTQLPEQGRLSTAAGRMSQGIASRMSRRSFVGYAGKVAVGATLGSALISIFPEQATAAQGLPDGTILDGILEVDETLSPCSDEPCSCGSSCRSAAGGVNCCGRKSATCGSIGSPGACPSGSCICGSWTTCSNSCASNTKTLHDCCGGCDSGLGCRCVQGSDGNLHPSCCRTKCYGGGCNTCSSYIKCRYSKCGSN